MKPEEVREAPQTADAAQRTSVTAAQRLVDVHAAWLLSADTRRRPLGEVLTGLGRRLGEGGIPVRRIRTSLITKHPEMFVRALEWSVEGGVSVLDRDRSMLNSPAFLQSPVALVRGGAPRVRCQLVGPDADLSFESCRELAAAGYTDYVAYPLLFGTGERTFLSFATSAEGGFSDEALEVFVGLLDPLAIRLEVESAHHATESLLRVYLGANAATRVLDGAFLRGTGQAVEAALFFCDMRGFTALADARPAGEVVAILDRFFEVVASPISPRGGEVLKFIGDAALAIFPVGSAGPADACARALEAARAAVDGVKALAERGGFAGLELGIALHLGTVMYGNIGARDRLDFTVIGAAVNEVCRVESLCKTLGPVLLTSAFARHCPAGSESRGVHVLKGVSAPQEIFVPR